MKIKLLKIISLLSVFFAIGAISGVSRIGMYQKQEVEKLTMLSVSASSYTTVRDTASKAVSSSIYGIGELSGRRDNSTDRLSNVKTSKTEKGVLVSFGDISRPNQYSAKVGTFLHILFLLYSAEYKAYGQKTKAYSPEIS